MKRKFLIVTVVCAMLLSGCGGESGSGDKINSAIDGVADQNKPQGGSTIGSKEPALLQETIDNTEGKYYSCEIKVSFGVVDRVKATVTSETYTTPFKDIYYKSKYREKLGGSSRDDTGYKLSTDSGEVLLQEYKGKYSRLEKFDRFWLGFEPLDFFKVPGAVFDSKTTVDDAIEMTGTVTPEFIKENYPDLFRDAYTSVFGEDFEDSELPLLTVKYTIAKDYAAAAIPTSVSFAIDEKWLEKDGSRSNYTFSVSAKLNYVDQDKVFENEDFAEAWSEGDIAEYVGTDRY